MRGTTLGTYIRSLRINKGMTQAQLAGLLNVTDKAVSKWERDLSYPDITILPKLADVLGVRVSSIIDESTVYYFTITMETCSTTHTIAIIINEIGIPNNYPWTETKSSGMC